MPFWNRILLNVKFQLMALCPLFSYSIHLKKNFALLSSQIPSVILQAARALANLAAHGDSNSNNATVGQEAGAFETLVQLTRSPHDGVR